MTYEEFKQKFDEEILPKKDSNLRDGQQLMIYLASVWMLEYSRISLGEYNKSNIDCFYNDRRMENTFQHLEENWSQYPN